MAAHGRTNIASESDPAITQANYPAVVKDLTPPAAAVNQGGLALMKHQPPRTRFWAEDLTIKHERFHCAEDQRFGGQGVRSAQNWLNTQTAANDNALFALLPRVIGKVGDVVKTGMAVPAAEQRAYDDGAPSYAARAQAIKRKGDARGYVPQPPAPNQQGSASPPAAAPQAPVRQPAPPARTTPSR